MPTFFTALVVAMFALASPVYGQAAKEPAKTETKQPAKPATPKKAPLELNTASEDELKALPGIGEAYSKKIIDNRPYARRDDLQGKVALSIDGDTWPYKVLQIRGTARVEIVSGIVPEYASAAERYFGAEQGRAWKQVGRMFSQMARIVVKPEWIAILDFEKRFPSAIEAAMSGH